MDNAGAAIIVRGLACGGARCPCNRAARRGWGLTHCPAHDDAHPSFSVTPGDDGVLIHCFVGCPAARLIAALREMGLWPQARRRNRTRSGRPRAVVTEYRYRGADSTLVAVKVRHDPIGGGKKWFVWRLPDGQASGGSIDQSRLPLYRLPELVATPLETLVVLVEGEKACDVCRAHGYTAVSLCGGSSQSDFGTALAALRDRCVVLIPDRDGTGHTFMRRVAMTLTGITREVRWLDLPELPPKGDIVEYFAADGTPADLSARMAAAPPAADHGVGEVCALCAEGDTTKDQTASFDDETGGRQHTVLLPPVPCFPVDVLPPVSRRLVEETAAAIGCPPDAVALPHLTYTGAVIGKRFRLLLKRGWEQFPVLWCGVVMAPGTAKTPAMSAARKPLDVLQREAHECCKKELAAFDEELARWSADKSGDRGPKPQRPEMAHYYSTDATTEAIARMLVGSPGFALHQDELPGWVRSFDQYRSGRGGDRQRMLSMWSSDPLKVDRKGADSIVVFDPVVPVVGGIQPDVLPELTEEAGRRDGFIERILFAYPDTTPTLWTDAEVSHAALDAVTAIYRQLRAPGMPAAIVLSPEARAVWVHWHDENQRATAAMGLAAGCYAKLPNQCARLALILHCLTHPKQPATAAVSADTMLAAIELTEYFRAHAHPVFTHFGQVGPVRGGGLAARILRILRANGDWINRRAIHEKLGGHVAAADRDAALADLQRQGLAEGGRFVR